MIKIMKEGLDLALDLLGTTEACKNSHNCLWIGRRGLFQIPRLLPKNCLRENCEIIVFRKRFEDNSPTFYLEALNLSRFAGVVKKTTAVANAAKRGIKEGQEELDRCVHDLHIFGQLLVLVIYPLFLEAKEIPFLEPAEIKKLRDNCHEAEIRQTVKRMNEINSDWLEWITSISGNLLSADEHYPEVITYLVYLFLKGMEKNQLPDFKNMTEEEKERFFSEIETMILKK